MATKKADTKNKKGAPDVNDGKPNLWNITRKKWQATREYISKLEPRPSWDAAADSLFKETIKAALATLDANAALELIGFNPMGVDEIYNNIHDEVAQRKKHSQKSTAI